MSACSVSRFYAATDVDSALSRTIESLFNRFIAAQTCKTGWHVDLQTSSPDSHRATITDPEGIAKSYAIPNDAQSNFSGNLLRQYQEYADRNGVAVDGNRPAKWHIGAGNVEPERLRWWRQSVRASLRAVRAIVP
jgi:hypothetical protein